VSDDRESIIREEGDLRKYRIELPNLIDDMELSPYEVRLYVHIKRRAGAGECGTCLEGTRRMAAVCKMSVGQVSQAKESLKKAGLIKIKSGIGPNSPDVITITDIWPRNFQTYAKAGARSSDEQGVHTVNRVFTERTQRCSPGELKKKHEYKKEPKKKEPHTQRAAQASPSRVCVKENQVENLSRHSFETCEKYAKSQPGIKNPGGWATQARRSGEYDKRITAWLASESNNSSSAPATIRNDFDFNLTQKFLDAARPRLNSDSFKRWFAPLECKQQDRQVVICAPCSTFEQYIRNCYADILEDVLDELKLSNHEIVFVEAKGAAQASAATV